MNRLGEENKSIGIVNKLIHELEIAIVEGQITESLLTKAQTKLDEMDDNLSEPNFRLYELQAIIHYANKIGRAHV